MNLDLSTLITPERLRKQLRLQPLVSNAVVGNFVDDDYSEPQWITAECQAVCNEIEAGTYRPREPLLVPPDGLLITPNPICYRIDQAVADLLAGSIERFVASLRPDHVLPW